MPLVGYTPVAITAVAVAVPATGAIARYPVYARLLGSDLAEATEVRAAIADVQGWLRNGEPRRAVVPASSATPVRWE